MHLAAPAPAQDDRPLLVPAQRDALSVQDAELRREQIRRQSAARVRRRPRPLVRHAG